MNMRFWALMLVVATVMVATAQSERRMCLIGTFTLLLMLLYDIQPVRSTMRRMMPLKVISQQIRRKMKAEGDDM